MTPTSFNGLGADTLTSIELASLQGDDADNRVFGLVAQITLLAEAGRAGDLATALTALEAEETATRDAALLRANLSSMGMVEPATAAPETTPSGVTSAKTQTHDAFGPEGLGAVYPNPAGGAATAPLVLTEAANVRVAVYDVLGREVAVVADGAMAPGLYPVSIAGDAWAPGIYLVSARVTTEGGATRIYVRRFTLTRP